MAKKFDFEKFKKEKIAVHCKTQEESDNFKRACIEYHLDYYTYAGEESNFFETYRSETCYSYDKSNGIVYSSKSWYFDNGYTILEWSDYMNKEFTKADLKPCYVVKRADGALRIIAEITDGLVAWDGFYIRISDYIDDLTCLAEHRYDIIEVYGFSSSSSKPFEISINNRELLYKRELPLRFTVVEAKEKLQELLGKKVDIDVFN